MGNEKKLAFTTVGCPEWPFGKILDEAEKMGFSGIEIRGIDDKMQAGEIVYFFPENRAATLAALKAHKLEIIGFGSSVQFNEAEKFDSMVDEGRRTIDICQFMGIPAVRIFGDRFSAGEPEADMIARVAKGAGILAEYGEARGVRVLLETHGDFNTLERIKGVFDQVESKNFRLLWDVGATDHEYGDNFMEFYRPVKDLISHTHIRDHFRGPPGNKNGFKYCRTGEGHVPIKAIVKQLQSDAYSGYFTLEWTKKWQPDLPGAEAAFPEFVGLMGSYLA
jgi:sugar phosphate isomerase/epimerase